MEKELTFLGLRISMSKAGIRMSQSRWIAQALRQRGFLHLTGAPCLPNLDAFGKLPPMKRNAVYDKELKQAQGELGSLLWIAWKPVVFLATLELKRGPSAAPATVQDCTN